jgi:endoplasmic reticulum-Golgi intermediate compartment protein 3
MFFVYDLAPFLVEIKRYRPPFSHLFTRLCAIVGGVFSLMGVLDSVTFRIQKLRSAVGM